jgi:hypothetical protein
LPGTKPRPGHNSGFTHIPDARVDYRDTASRKPFAFITVGKYPFHSPKRGRDGNLMPPTAAEMWFSDQCGEGATSTS